MLIMTCKHRARSLRWETRPLSLNGNCKKSISLAGLIWGVYYTEGTFKKITASILYKGLMAFSGLWIRSSQCNLKCSHNFNKAHIRNRFFFLFTPYARESSYTKIYFLPKLSPASSLCRKERMRISKPAWVNFAWHLALCPGPGWEDEATPWPLKVQQVPCRSGSQKALGDKKHQEGRALVFPA